MTVASQYKTETVFDYSWKQVAQAYWQRYPNPTSTHVLTEDTISREVRDGKLYSRRLLSKTNHVPKWGERFYKNTPVKIIEDSILDPKKKTLITFTRNIGFKKIMKVDEIVEYSEQKDGRTLAVRRAYISSQVFGFSRAIRAFGVERFKSNCHKAANGFNHVLYNMFPHHAARAAAAAAKSAQSHVHLPHQQQQQQAVEPLPANATTATVKSEQQQQQQQQQHSKTEAITKATKAGYEYFKCQASKVAQMFSVKN